MERRDNDNKGLISALALADALRQKRQSRRPASGVSMLMAMAASVVIGFPDAAIAENATGQAVEKRGKPAHARFNTAFIQGSDQPPDLKAFLEGASVVPGTYRVDVFVNRGLSGRRDITFSANPVTGAIEPCLTLEMLVQFGLDSTRLKEAGASESSASCFDLPARVEFARVDYQPNNPQRQGLRPAGLVGSG
jgi:outer membrane usher protein